MKQICFFCREAIDETCPLSYEPTEDKFNCSLHMSLTEEEIRQVIDDDLKAITKTAQEVGLIPPGLTIQEYYAVVHRKKSKKPDSSYH